MASVSICEDPSVGNRVRSKPNGQVCCGGSGDERKWSNVLCNKVEQIIIDAVHSRNVDVSMMPEANNEQSASNIRFVLHEKNESGMPIADQKVVIASPRSSDVKSEDSFEDLEVSAPDANEFAVESIHCDDQSQDSIQNSDELIDDELNAIHQVSLLMGGNNQLRMDKYIEIDNDCVSVGPSAFPRMQETIDRRLLSTKSSHSLSWYLRRGVLSRCSIRHMLSDQGDYGSSDSSDSRECGDSKGNSGIQSRYENVLEEGQCYLAMCMLIYMYTRLRENCILGYTKINYNEIDVDSEKSDQMSAKYLNNTRSVGFIVRAVMDELDHKRDETPDQNLFGENGDYDKA